MFGSFTYISGASDLLAFGDVFLSMVFDSKFRIDLLASFLLLSPTHMPDRLVPLFFSGGIFNLSYIYLYMPLPSSPRQACMS